jgi:hypothetical protein
MKTQYKGHQIEITKLWVFIRHDKKSDVNEARRFVPVAHELEDIKADIDAQEVK